jgi:hypothetical protein
MSNHEKKYEDELRKHCLQWLKTRKRTPIEISEQSGGQDAFTNDTENVENQNFVANSPEELLFDTPTFQLFIERG